MSKNNLVQYPHIGLAASQLTRKSKNSLAFAAAKGSTNLVGVAGQNGITTNSDCVTLVVSSEE